LKRLYAAKNNNNFNEVLQIFYAINLIDSSQINLEENILYIVKNGVGNREYIDASDFAEILKSHYENKPELLRILTEQIKICDDVFLCMTLFFIVFKIEPQNPELKDLFVDIQQQCEQDWFASEYFNKVFISELEESSETYHENQNVNQNQNVKRLSDFDRRLLKLYNHLLEINDNEQEENYSFAIQIIKEIQSASYKKNINSSDIIYFKYLLIGLFRFLLKILKLDQAQTELVSRIFRAGSKRKNRRALLYKGFRKPKSRARINKDTNSYTVHLFISFFATVGQKIDLIKDKVIEIFIKSLSIESKEGSFSPTGLTRIIHSNIHKMSLSKQEMIDIIIMIKNENIDIVVETEEVLSSPIISLFRDFAKCLDYPEFYQAWYGQPEIAQTLNQQIIDLPSQLQSTEKTDPLVINAKSLEKITNENSLSQALCNKIYKRIFPQITDIPKVNDPSGLEREIIKIKGQIQKQNLALIFHKGEPNETLINVCEQLTDEIYYKFISNQSLEQAIPSQENLVNILQNWINQLD
jgi:hypothetical protein